MQKRLATIIFLIIFTLSSYAEGARKGKRFIGFPEGLWGAGPFLGEPSGLRIAKFTNWKRAWSFTLGYSFSNVITGTADYLFYLYNARDKVLDQDFFNALIFYAGFGVKGGFGLPAADLNDQYQAGLRLVGGSEYLFTDTPWSLKVEVAPEFFLKAKNSFGISVGLAFVYYFYESAPKTLRRQAQPDSSRPPSKGAPPPSEGDDLDLDSPDSDLD